jgi:hypothetical protein
MFAAFIVCAAVCSACIADVGEETPGNDNFGENVAATTTPLPHIPNVSARAIVGLGNKVLIGGFIVSAGNTKTIVVRGLGPSLGGTLLTPKVEIFRGSTSLASNQGWKHLSATDQAALAGYGLTPGKDGDSALIYRSFTPGAYTVILSGGSGLGLVELYDVTVQSSIPENNSQLVNFSARAFVTPGTGALIVGVTTNPLTPYPFGLQAYRGTSVSTLQPAGLSPVLSNPQLQYFELGQLVFSNDNWSCAPNYAYCLSLAPKNALESLMIFGEPDVDQYAATTVLSGVNGTTSGYGLLEFFTP